MEPEAYAAMVWIRRWFYRPLSGVLWVSLAAVILTAIFASFQDERRLPDVAMLYLALTLVSAVTWGYVIGAYSAVLTNVLLNFFFIPPLHEFNVADRGNVAGLVLFLLVAALAAWFASRLRDVSERLESAVTENATLYDLNNAVASSPANEAPVVFCSSAVHGLGAQRVELIEDRGGWMVLAGSGRAGQRLGEQESSIVARVWEDAAAHRESMLKTARDPLLISLPPGDPPAVVMIAGIEQPPRCIDLDRFLSAIADQARVALRIGPAET
jgi:K+-sensing histidine kinase KdpD